MIDTAFGEPDVSWKTLNKNFKSMEDFCLLTPYSVEAVELW